jgi:hypothetical protein
MSIDEYATSTALAISVEQTGEQKNGKFYFYFFLHI